MIGKILGLLLFISLIKTASAQDCGYGCLRCSSNGICLLCDNMNFYVRSGYICIYNKIQNCVATIDGLTCQRCATGYFYNNTNSTCSQVTTLRNYCQYYDVGQRCAVCNNTSYFADPVNGGCVALVNPVVNCFTYSADGVCTLCNNGYYVSTNSSTCIQVPTTSNCQLYSGMISCALCQSGFFLLRNKYLIDLKTNYAFLLGFYKEMISSIQVNVTLAKNMTNVCSVQSANCVGVSPYNTCTNCSAGYFSNQGACQLNPVQTISNCIIYSQATVCVSCQAGYFLNGAVCSLVSAIANCVVYDNTVNNNCLMCSSAYFSSGLTCTVRLNNILNCLVYQTSADLCQTCQSSYWLTPDYLTCLFNVQYCLNSLFMASSSGGYTAACSQCLNQFYIYSSITNGILTTICQLPTQLIEGCLVYQQAKLCSQCISGYYLANFQCLKHDVNVVSMINCPNLSTTQFNQCAGCNTNQYLFKLINYCAPVSTQLSNCYTYGAGGICNNCTAGYYIALNAQGSVICSQTNITSCILTDVTTNTCIKCDPQTGTMPNNNKQINLCTTIPMSFTANCQNFVVNIMQNVTNCNSCFVPYYPLLMNSVYFQYCYPFTEFQLIGNGTSQTNITNLGSCLSFDLRSLSCLMCDPASITPLISSQTPGICSQVCVWGDEVVLTFSFVGMFPNSFFQCSQVSLIHMAGDSSTNCQRADYDVSVTVTTPTEAKINQYCAQCLSNYIPAITSYTSNYYSHYDYLPMAVFNNKLSATSYFSPLIKNPLFASCKTWTTTFMTNNNIPFNSNGLMDYTLSPLGSYTANSIYFVLNWQNFQKCDVLIAETQSNGYPSYGCASCAFQYTGPAITSTLGTNFIYNCVAMTTCDTTVYYSAIGSHDINAQLYLYASCHSCLDNTKIVTFTSVKPWSFPTSDPTQTLNYYLSSNGYYPVNSCYIPGMISSSQANFPSNCQIQQIIPSQSFQPYTQNLSIPPNPLCVACAPMYMPTVSSTNIPNEVYRFIISCKLIANCSSSVTFNACDQCATGYVIQANTSAVGNTLGYPCVMNNIVGCQIGFVNGTCVQCMARYTLNVYGFCDSFIMPICTSFGNLTPYTSAYQYLTTNPFPQGCLICQTGTYNVRFPFPVTLCVQSLSTTTTLISPNFFIPNCIYYGMSSSYVLTCTICATGYSPSNTNNACFKVNTIPNCMIYAGTSNLLVPVCFQCANAYYLANNLCFVGEIKNCLVYIDRYDCQTCASGMVATKVDYSLFILCFDISTSLTNCQTFDLNSAFSGYLSCNNCSPNNYLISFGVPISTCSVFSTVNNCLQYSIQATFLKTTFFCLLCTPPYFIVLNIFPSICNTRLNYPIGNCLNYTTSTDTCKNCIVGFYLSANGLNCIQNPNGVQGCRVYLNVTACAECDGTMSYYLVNGVCVTLPTTLVVINCYTYNSQSICTLCIAGYQYINGVCNSFSIQNCLTAGLGNVCLGCQTGYTLIVNSCNIVNIANCQTYSSVTNCQTCLTGFYVNGGRCFQPNSIPNCSIFTSQTQCNTCANQFILASDFTSCTSLVGTQLLQANTNCKQYQTTTMCIYCKFGYTFDPVTGICGPCGGTQIGACAVCDNMNPALCLICSSGYYMVSNSSCYINVAVVVASVVVNDPNKDFYTLDMARYGGRLILMIVIFLGQ